MDTNKTITKHIIITYKEAMIQMLVDFSSQTKQKTREHIYSSEKKNHCKPRILDSVKTPFKHEGKMKRFSHTCAHARDRETERMYYSSHAL